jgi:RNA polymerase sigma-70 factor, ECF subfamily
MPEPPPPTSSLPNARKSRPDDLEAVVSAVRQGDQRAVRTFIAAIGPAMLRVIRQVMGSNCPDAEDLLQEASLNVLDALPRFAEDCSILHFACRTAVLTAMNARRREAATKRGWRWLSRTELDVVPAAEASFEKTLDERKAMIAVRHLMTTLPVAQAEALALHCVLGCTIEEIASTLSISPETVRSRLRLSKQSLRRRVLGDATLTDIVEGAS